MALTPEQKERLRKQIREMNQKESSSDLGSSTASNPSIPTTREEMIADLKRSLAEDEARNRLIQQATQPKKESVFDKVKDFGIGALKGAGSTLLGGAELFEKSVFRPLDKVLPGQRMTSDNETSSEALGLNEAVKPINTAQKAGFGVEQVAEFFLPGGAAAKASKAAGLATKGSKLAKIGALAATEGAVGAGQVALQEGDVNKGTLGAGVASAIAGPFLKGAGALATKTKSSLWTQVLGRTSKMIEKNPNLEKQIAETGIAGSRKQIRRVAQENIQQIETELDDVLSVSTEKIKGSDVAGYLNNLKKSYSSIPGEENAVKIIENLQKQVTAKGSLTAKEANDIKREIYKVTSKSYGKGTLEIPAKLEAQKQLARGLKSEIEKIIPEAKTLNEKQAIYIQTVKALDRVLTQPRKGIAGTGIGMYDLLLGGATLGATGGDLETTAKIVAGKKIAESATLRTGASKLINYFNNLSPTKKLMFYNALKGMFAEGGKTTIKETE